jgi:hypothetical protein
MRFAILLVGGLATGALSVSGIRTMVPPNSQMFQAVRALGGDMTNLKMADFNIADINPLKAYEEVKRKITSGNFGGPINFSSATSFPKLGDFPKVGDLSLGNRLHLDQAAIKRAMAAGINSSIQQSIRRSQDISAYSRNPAGWHGAPPF